MRTTVLLAIVLFIVGCTSVRPVAIRAGDVCESCRRPILNVNAAAEVVQANGIALKFRSVGCMARFIRQSASQPAGVFVTDFQSGRLIAAHSAMFVRGAIDPQGRDIDYLAFSGEKAALEYGKSHGNNKPVDWPGIQQRVAAGAAN